MPSWISDWTWSLVLKWTHLKWWALLRFCRSENKTVLICSHLKWSTSPVLFCFCVFVAPLKWKWKYGKGGSFFLCCLERLALLTRFTAALQRISGDERSSWSLCLLDSDSKPPPAPPPGSSTGILRPAVCIFPFRSPLLRSRRLFLLGSLNFPWYKTITCTGSTRIRFNAAEATCVLSRHQRELEKPTGELLVMWWTRVGSHEP